MMRSAILALALGVAGCGQAEDAPAANPGAQREEETVGVTDDGTQIIFAGPRREGRQGQQSRTYDEERLRRTPNSPDPERGEFTLEEAVQGLPVDGTLVAEIGTEFGTLLCDLYADRAPRTVANFIGLARGTRPWWDARAGEWVRRPYYRGLPFHRVIPGYLVQTGDYLEDGTGTVGYTIPDEIDDTLSHDRAGKLVMASQQEGETVVPNSAGAQFFLSDGPSRELDRGGYTIFGQCQPLDTVAQIARVPQDAEAGNRPLTPIHITRLIIQRVEGGAANATRTLPAQPPGEPDEPRGASGGPGEVRGPPRPPLPSGHDGHGH
jgi:peptidyl-prolyl cis-trans isomerase A (cyclophilin A)